MSKLSTIWEMDLVGGAACLDFVNTGLDENRSAERIHSYNDLLVINQRLSLLNDRTLDCLKHIANEKPSQAQQVLIKARDIRQSMQSVFTALATGQGDQLTTSQLKIFNDHINEALVERIFIYTEGKLKSTWEHPEKKLMQPIWTFCLSAQELLGHKDQRLIKQCGACAWIFFDETKNHRRKWCDMQTCGTNQKARRYYQRHKDE